MAGKKTTRASKSEPNVIQDAQQVLKDLTKAMPRIEKENRATKKKGGVNTAFAKKLAAAIASFGGAAQTQGAQRSTAKKSTAAEVAARAALAKELQAIRADVVEVVTDPTVQADFGRGRRIVPKSTGELLATADDFASAYKAHKAAVQDAGVNDARMKNLAKLRAALASADTTQRSELNAKSDASKGKRGALKTIQTMVGAARKRLARLGAPSKAQSARRASKPRASKKTAAVAAS